MEISKKGKSLLLVKDNNESNEIFLERMWFIVSQDTIDDETIKLSKIWINIKYLECRYSPYIYNKVVNMSKKIFS